jgi:hypothetical protein
MTIVAENVGTEILGGGPEDPVADAAVVGEDAGYFGSKAVEKREARTNQPPASNYQGSSKGQNQNSPSPSASRSTVTFKDTSYHRIVMAEYIGCMVLLAAAPLVGEPKDKDGNDLSTGVALFGADALIRMTAVSLVFLILALMANHEKPGKFASAFGGLILVGLLVNTDASFWTKLGSFFTGGTGSAPSGSATSTAASTTSAASKAVTSAAKKVLQKLGSTHGGVQ